MNNLTTAKILVSHAGGGGVEAAFLDLFLNEGIRPEFLSLECNPSNPAFSSLLLNNHRNNFNNYGKSLLIPLQDWVKDYPVKPESIDFFHVSPMCSNFSQASQKTETLDDIAVAQAIAKCIKDQQPKFLTLENVGNYIKSESFKIIIKALDELNYLYYFQVINCADYGIPQTRKRLFLIAGDRRQLNPCAKDKFEKTFYKFQGLEKYKTDCNGWFEAIESEGEVSHLPLTNLTQAQTQALKNNNCYNYKGDGSNRYFLIPRLGYRSLGPRVIPQNKPAPTILASIFIDYRHLNYRSGSGGSRKQIWTVWDCLRQQAHNLRIQEFAKLATFPNWYQFPENDAIAGVILGYAVPPRMMKILIESADSAFRG
jgi:DNA (cytosine-5)-methyltransferase 1